MRSTFLIKYNNVEYSFDKCIISYYKLIRSAKQFYLHHFIKQFHEKKLSYIICLVTSLKSTEESYMKIAYLLYPADLPSSKNRSMRKLSSFFVEKYLIDKIFSDFSVPYDPCRYILLYIKWNTHISITFK